MTRTWCSGAGVRNCHIASRCSSSQRAAAQEPAFLVMTPGRHDALLIVGPSWLGDAVMMGALAAPPEGGAAAAACRGSADRRRIWKAWSGFAGCRRGADQPVCARGVAARRRGPGSAGTCAGRFGEAIVLPQSWKSAADPAVRRHSSPCTGFVGEARYGVLERDARPLDEAVASPRMARPRFLLLAVSLPGAATPAATPAAADCDGRSSLWWRRDAGALLGLTDGNRGRRWWRWCVGAEYGSRPSAGRPQHFARPGPERLAAEVGATWVLGGPRCGDLATRSGALAPEVVNLAGRDHAWRRRST